MYKIKINLIFLIFFMSNSLFSQDIDTKHLLLNLKFDWQKRQAIGFAEITFSPTVATSKIELDAGMLRIQSVFLKEKALQFQYDGSDTSKLEIELDRIYQPNETLVLKINYHSNYENRADPNAIWGSFGKGLRFQEPTSTTPNKRKQIWSSGEPNHNKYWFPCHEDISDIHSTEIIATIEKPLMLISNGNLMQVIENQDNTRTFHYKNDRAFPNYLVSLVVGEYTDILQKTKGTTLHNFGYPHEKEAVEATTELLPDMLQFLETKTAYQYPFEQYSQVVVQDYPFPGLVGQNTVSTLSDNYIDDHGVHQDFKYLWDGVAVQALANQWFGNLIMPKSWEDIWLNNAFAQYFAGLYTAKNNSQAEYLTYVLPFEKSNVVADWDAENKHPIVTGKYDNLVNFTTDSYSKYRGALVLRMLQKELGEATWWKAIQLYVKTNAKQQVSTKDFQNAIETSSGKSYQWFFDQWIYKIGLPKFEVSKNYDADKKQLILHLKQTQNQENKTNYAQNSYFQGKIEIEIDDKIEQIFIEPKAENTYFFSRKKAPLLVNFNVEEVFLCETEFKKSNEEYLQQLQKSKDIIAQQKALDKLVEIAKDTATTPNFKAKIVTAFKNEISSQKYWRYRAYALASLRKILTLPYDVETVSMLLNLIKTEKSWLKTSAIFTLGNSNDEKYTDIYIDALNDKSDRVVNAAATALGKTKSPKALDILINLDKKPSWKNQSRISALNGLEQLKDTKSVDYVLKCLSDNQSARWYLATPIWDYPFAAVNTLVALDKADLGFPILFERFKKSLNERDLNDIFQNVQLIDLLKDERAKEMYELLKATFKDDANVLETVKNYENAYLENFKK
jgi:aminopeptidase N